MLMDAWGVKKHFTDCLSPNGGEDVLEIVDVPHQVAV